MARRSSRRTEHSTTSRNTRKNTPKPGPGFDHLHLHPQSVVNLSHHYHLQALL